MATATDVGGLTAEQAATLAARREYNRTYMQRWRADPEHKTRERRNRVRWDLKRKLVPMGHAEDNGRCAFCKQRRAVTQIERLRVVGRGYVRVILPYCGDC